MARSLNKVTLIGNLTRDPELKYTPKGAAVCTFGLATNRQWTTDSGEKKDSVEFHNLVVWNKLAELCAEYLAKGRRVYVEGRLQTRKWVGQDDVERRTTEIVLSEIIFLDAKGSVPSDTFNDIPEDLGDSDSSSRSNKSTKEVVNKEEKPPTNKLTGKESKNKKVSPKESDTAKEDEDIPF